MQVHKAEHGLCRLTLLSTCQGAGRSGWHLALTLPVFGCWTQCEAVPSPDSAAGHTVWLFP